MVSANATSKEFKEEELFPEELMKEIIEKAKAKE